MLQKLKVRQFSLSTSKYLISWMRTNREMFRKWLICSSMSTSNSYIVNFMNMSLKVLPPTRPHRVTLTLQEADQFFSFSYSGL